MAQLPNYAAFAFLHRDGNENGTRKNHFSFSEKSELKRGTCSGYKVSVFLFPTSEIKTIAGDELPGHFADSAGVVCWFAGEPMELINLADS